MYGKSIHSGVEPTSYFEAKVSVLTNMMDRQPSCRCIYCWSSIWNQCTLKSWLSNVIGQEKKIQLIKHTIKWEQCSHTIWGKLSQVYLLLNSLFNDFTKSTLQSKAKTKHKMIKNSSCLFYGVFTHLCSSTQPFVPTFEFFWTCNTDKGNIQNMQLCGGFRTPVENHWSIIHLI